MSFRLRLIGATLAIGALSLGGALIITYISVERSELRQLDAALLEEALEEAAEVAALGGESLAIASGPRPYIDDTGPLTTYGVLYRVDGTVLDQTPTFRAEIPALEDLEAQLERPFELMLGEEAVRAVLVPVPFYDDAILLLAAPRAFLDDDLKFLNRTLLLVLLGALVWSALVAAWVLGYLTRDHRAIATAVRAVAAGDLSARVNIREKADETGQLAADVNHMIDRIEHLLHSQRQFIAHASHELRSPITLLYGELSHALRRSRQPESYRASIEEALESTRKLKALSEHLLALARLSSGRSTAGSVVSLLQVASNAVRSRAGKTELSNVILKGDDVWVQADVTDLEQMVYNLVDNALRHSPPGGKVWVTVEARGERARLAVRDQGQGVPEAERQRIFEPFYRSPWVRAREDQGTGLGLAIVRETARTHGGEVWLEADSHAHSGACFVVELPAVVGRKPAVDQPAQAAGSVSSPREKVLPRGLLPL